eukprot:TRINITY_DN9471_c0_g2_i1.p1 TRINITY_DN9471_c0_g2~~TRINITY_DN9471_c0_g2_i1.p1  ORF type:complete len:110 (-),score=5.49 TRINITY_DN9471_c0_g2_i1:293-622(-)
MIALLTERPGCFVRPSRVRSMLASRACRSSIMVGKVRAVDMPDLCRFIALQCMASCLAESHWLVLKVFGSKDHDNRSTGEIDQPWNCPHGRPTMRHLFNLEAVPGYLPL